MNSDADLDPPVGPTDGATPADDAAAAEVDDAADATAMPNRRTALLRTGVIVGVLVLVFGVILPRFVDYEEVFAALGALTLPQFLFMSAFGVFAWFVSGLLYVVVVPGLSAIRGTEAYLILSGIGASVPFGPWNMGVVWVILRGWGVALQAATTGIALYGVINTLGRFALPLVAIIVLALGDSLGGSHNAAFVISIISIAIFFLATGVMLAVVRSDRAAGWVGRTADRYVALVLGRLGRHESPDVEGGILRFRASLGDVVRQRGLAGLLVNIASQIPWCIAFIVALRLCGVPSDAVTAADIVAVFALTSVITIIPIAPGGAGVPELLYIGMLSTIAPSYEAAITAGVFLFRLYVWFLPIPIAWILLKIVRRGRPMLPTTSELRSYAATSA
jgi:uncharacterized membrane protein YbhN (UPF0104 family)